MFEEWRTERQQVIRIRQIIMGQVRCAEAEIIGCPERLLARRVVHQETPGYGFHNCRQKTGQRSCDRTSDQG